MASSPSCSDQEEEEDCHKSYVVTPVPAHHENNRGDGKKSPVLFCFNQRKNQLQDRKLRSARKAAQARRVMFKNLQLLLQARRMVSDWENEDAGKSGEKNQ